MVILQQNTARYEIITIFVSHSYLLREVSLHVCRCWPRNRLYQINALMLIL